MSGFLLVPADTGPSALEATWWTHILKQQSLELILCCLITSSSSSAIQHLIYIGVLLLPACQLLGAKSSRVVFDLEQPLQDSLDIQWW